jgi:hypothetical protein
VFKQTAISKTEVFYMAWSLRKKPSGVKRIGSVKPIKPIKPIRPVKPIAPVGHEYYWRD